MSIEIKHDPNEDGNTYGTYTIDASELSEDDGDDFYFNPKPRVDIKTSKDQEKKARHDRYQANPELERERLRLKRQYKNVKQSLLGINQIRCPKIRKSLIETIKAEYLVHPNRVYIRDAVGNRDYYKKLEDAVRGLKPTDVLIAVDDMYVKCEDVKDCDTFTEKLKTIKQKCKQVLLPNMLSKMVFILNSDKECNIEAMKELLSTKFEVRMRDIVIEKIGPGSSFVIVRTVTGTHEDHALALRKLQNMPPAEYVDLAKLIKILETEICRKSNMHYVGADITRETPYSYQNGSPITINVYNIHNDVKVGGNVDIHGDGSGLVNITSGSINKNDEKMTEREKLEIQAKEWVRQNSPDNKSTVEYYDDYIRQFPDGLGSTNFQKVVKSLGFTKRKKSARGGKNYWEIPA